MKVATRVGIIVLLYSAGMILFGVTICKISHAEDYVYNFSKGEKIEFNLMSLCFKGDDFGIDAMTYENKSLEQWCAERYGGIDTLYGEAKK